MRLAGDKNLESAPSVRWAASREPSRAPDLLRFSLGDTFYMRAFVPQDRRLHPSKDAQYWFINTRTAYNIEESYYYYYKGGW